jgi:platelet-activating factor acetylhydrolase
VHQNADILSPLTKSKRWPVMIFSHGLGGSRNSYSHVVGSLASHGIVVIAPDHRDGSSPISFVRNKANKGKLTAIEYRRIPHQASTEVYQARDEQLRVRLWELGLIHDAILKIDEGISLENLTADRKTLDGKDQLAMFKGMLDAHKPGSIALGGHSFGAATMIQFVKSTFYLSGAPDSDYDPLFTPSISSSIVRQITPATPVFLLDLWALPIQSPATAWLKKKPMPCYNSPHGGSNLLSILSDAFFKWSTNLRQTQEVVAKPSHLDASVPGPHVFYPISSAHLSQSDFGVLFPWVTTKFFGAKEPERILKLNVRAILQVLRGSHFEVADTSAMDMEIDTVTASEIDPNSATLYQDRILSTKTGDVRDWVSLGTDVKPNVPLTVSKGPGDAVVEGEVLGQLVEEQAR